MRIHHIALRTSHPARLEAFYRDVIGLSTASQPAGQGRVWLSADLTLVMIEPRDAGEPDVPRGSMDLLAFEIAPEARGELLARLRRAKVALEGETSFTLYFRDPDGRRVGVSHYPNTAASDG